MTGAASHEAAPTVPRRGSCTVQLVLLREHAGSASSTMGVRLDVAPSLYSTCFRLQSIGVEPTATVMQVAALTHQSCLGKMRNNRRHEQNCSGEANNSLRVLFHLLGANPKTKPQGSMLAFLSRQIEKAKCSASHRSIPRPTWRCQRTRPRQVNLVISWLSVV